MKLDTREILTTSLVLATMAALVGALIVALREPPHRSVDNQRSEAHEPASEAQVEVARYSPQATNPQQAEASPHADEDRLPAEVASRARPWNEHSTDYGAASPSALTEPKKVLSLEEIQSGQW